MSIVPASRLSADELSRLGNNFGRVGFRRSYAPSRHGRRRRAPGERFAAPATVVGRPATPPPYPVED